MSKGWSLNSGNRTQTLIDLQSVGARGLVSPRLLLVFHAETPNERTRIEFHDMRVRVMFGQELLGETRIVGEQIGSQGRSIQMEIPTTHRMLNHVTEQLGAQAQVNLTLSWYGILRVLWEPTESDARYQGDPDPGVWTDLQIDEGNHEQSIMVSRSDWFSRVVTAVGTSDFIFTEVAVPKGPLGDKWRSALALLDKADKAFALGDDASCFLHLRGIIDSLPGAKQDIFADLPEPQNVYVDDLTKSVGKFLHSGRHVADLGNGDVRFPVDHIDARFAINLVRVLLSYASISIDAAQNRANK
jgi:hypothetical protein